MGKYTTICWIVVVSVGLCGVAQGQMIFGVDMDNLEIVYLNSQSGLEVARFAVPDSASASTSDDDIGLAGSLSGQLYYCNGDVAPGTVYVLDTGDGSVLTTVTLTGGWNVNGLGYESGAAALFTSGCGALDMHKYPAGGGGPTFYWGDVYVDNAVGGDDHGRVFAAQLGTGDIVEVSPSVSSMLNVVDVDLDGDIVGMAYDGTNLYASTTAGMLYTLDPDDGSVLNALDLGYTLDALAAAPGGPGLLVDVDIKPGSFPSSINLKSKGVTPAAILTTDAFDASTVDPTTVRFNTLVPAVKWSLYDCDHDGDLDLVLHFDTQDLVMVLSPGDTEATLTGETFDGTPIGGIGDVRIVEQGKP
jgi:hypothetical protein